MEYFSLGDIIGYTGAVLLVIRFLPVFYLELKNIRKKELKSVHPFFIIIELASSVLMFSSAFMLWKFPFMIANGFTIIAYIVLIIIQIIKRKINNQTPSK